MRRFLRILSRLRDSFKWAIGKGTVVGTAYCPWCEREIDDCEIE